MVVDTLNNEINNVTQWSNKNNLSLNIDKTKFMVVRKKLNTIDVNSHMGIWVDGVKIEQVQEFKYLGVIIDEHLTFSKHASYVTRKIAQKVNALGRVRKTLSKWSKVLIYKTIIVPHLNYCPTILFLLNNSEIATMQKRQNQALRIILDTNRYANINAMLDSLGILSVRQFIYFNTVIFVFKMIRGLMPKHLLDNCMTVDNVHDHFTRNANNFYIRPVRRTFDQKDLFHRELKLYNELPNHIKDCENLKTFKTYSFKHIKDTNLE